MNKNKIKEIIIDDGNERRTLEVIKPINGREFLVKCEKCYKGAKFNIQGKLYCKDCGYLEIFM